jgi:ferric-dicitrate binding protein FerR (iron transport regulator)
MNTPRKPLQPRRSSAAENGAREAWVERAVALLDESARNLDAATLSRLNRARQTALAPRRRPRQAWLVGGSLAAAALALVIGVGLGHRVSSPTASPADAAGQDEIDALVGDDNPDLYENLEFYAWLNAQQQDGNG